MSRRIPLLALALASAIVAPAYAEEATVSYQGVVTSSSGAQAALFAAGQEISVSYTVETTAADTDPHPGNGVFHGGLVALRISIPAVGVDAQVGTGTVQTFDNEVGGNSDQVFFAGIPTAGSLGGLPLTRAEVDFLDFDAGPGGFPIMIDSQDIPTHPLVTDDSFAILYTSAGTTFVRFLAEADEATPAELAEDGRELVQDLVDDGRLRRGQGAALDSKFASVLAAIDAGDTATACGSLGAFHNQVNAMQRSRQIDAATAAELREAADALGDALGC
ncbi:hypothetical protein [Arenimonas sp.]|uniref:FIMAH domain-containing protein n=1 Tax=Arenimonas sp. TaxID=1872635 RepID=UPI0035AF911E